MSLKRQLDPIVRDATNGKLYLMYKLTDEEKVGEFSYDGNTKVKTNSIQGVLRNLGFSHPPKKFFIGLEAVKQHPKNPENLHDMSFRLRPEEMPEAAKGTELESYDPKQLQYHIHIFAMEDRYEVYSHLELAPDLSRLANESFGDMVNRATNHLSPTWSQPAYDKDKWSYIRGAAPKELTEILE